ncbi:MAG: sensor histidine kinase [Flavobacteriaceae bacterium]|nr:sensor histidine kinase [Flavobacteriaceae bacterium]
MVKKTCLLLLFSFFYLNVPAQKKENKQPSKIKIAEDFIFKQQLDSALVILNSLPTTTRISSLKRIALKVNPSYKDYYRLISIAGNNLNRDYSSISNYINNNIPTPKAKEINLDYVKIKWIQAAKLRDYKTVAEASVENEKLVKYIAQFNASDKEVKKAKIYANIHDIVIYTIQRDLKKGKNLCLENLQTAKEIKDTRLIIAMLYHLCDFVILEGKLQEYIDLCEEGLALEKELENKSEYYIATISHAVDAYIYRGKSDKRVAELLKILYEDEDVREVSYIYYSKYLGTIKLDSKTAKDIFEQFNVSNILQFCSKIRALGKKVLNSNDYYQLVRENSATLEKHNYLREAIVYKDEAIGVIRKIYSNDLANSLANAKTKIAVKEKEIQIKHEKERARLSIIISSLVGLLLLISVIVTIRVVKQRKTLAIKNKEIAEQRDALDKALKEKELLVKEVHHRVKNNFQIVSSLLELQSKDIEDEKALELANEGKARVKSMALIHQKLYQNESGLVDFDEYIKLLVNELTALYASDKEVNTQVKTENIKFDVDTAIPLGLIINELITNTYKYAFDANKKNELLIQIHKKATQEYELVIKDNGPGLDSSIDFVKAKSLGLRLVKRLVKQLQGTLKQTNDDGAKYVIVFKDVYLRKQIE